MLICRFQDLTSTSASDTVKDELGTNVELGDKVCQILDSKFSRFWSSHTNVLIGVHYLHRSTYSIPKGSDI